MSSDNLEPNPYAYTGRCQENDDADADLVLSSGFKQRLLLVMALGMLPILWVLPPGIILMGSALGLSHGLQAWTLAIVAASSSLMIFLVFYANVSTFGYGGLRERLAYKLESRGYELDQDRDVFVELSPANRPKSYENCTNWDIGFLRLTRDELVYLGDRIQFQLKREQIIAIQVGPGNANPLHPKAVYVQWRGHDQSLQVFNLCTGGPGSWSQLRRQTPSFIERIKKWHDCPDDAMSSRSVRPLNIPILTTIEDGGKTFWQATRPWLFLLALPGYAIIPQVFLGAGIVNGVSVSLLPAVLGSSLPSIIWFLGEAVLETRVDNDVFPDVAS